MLQYVMAQVTARRSEEGQGLVEYGLIIVLVALAVIATLGLVGDELINVFNDVVTGLQDA